MSLCIFLICICNIAVSIRSVFLIGLSNPDNEIRLSFITLNQHKIALYQHFYHYVPSLLINTVVNILLNGIVFLLSVFYDRIPIMFLSNATTLGIFVPHTLLKCARAFPMKSILYCHISYGIVWRCKPFCLYVSFWLQYYQLKSNDQKNFYIARKNLYSRDFGYCFISLGIQHVYRLCVHYENFSY